MQKIPSRIAPLLALLLVGGCGPASTPQSATTSAPSVPAATTAATRPAAVTPDQVCALVALNQMSEITGYSITSTRPEMSGNVAVCHFVGAAADGFVSSKVILEYQPDGKTAVEYTKASGEAVAGLGTFAVYHQTGGQLSVEVGGQAVFHVFVEDLRINHNDPKGAAVRIAQTAVPRLAQA